jgi:ribosomal protein S6--L-glutamate ligase
LDIPTIKARVDSGAKHLRYAINIAPFIKNETNWVRFDQPYSEYDLESGL